MNISSAVDFPIFSFVLRSLDPLLTIALLVHFSSSLRDFTSL